MPGPDLHELIRQIDARLSDVERRRAEIERERKYLIDLRYYYTVTGEAPPLPTAMRASGAPVSYTAPAFPPVPDSEKVRLQKDASGKTGMSALITRVVRKHPGLEMSALITRVIDHIISDEPVRRDAIRSMIKYMRQHHKLDFKNGGYYAPETLELKVV